MPEHDTATAVAPRPTLVDYLPVLLPVLLVAFLLRGLSQFQWAWTIAAQQHRVDIQIQLVELFALFLPAAVAMSVRMAVWAIRQRLVSSGQLQQLIQQLIQQLKG